MITERIGVVNTSSHSVLPTGRLKFENGVLYQEATIIRHRPTEGKPVGMSEEWIPVPKELVDFIKTS